VILLSLLFENPSAAIDERFFRFTFNSVSVALIAGFFALVSALLLSYGVRLHPTWITRASARVGTLGYAIPGSVIAVGLLIPFGLADQTLNDLSRRLFGFSPGLLLSGTLFALVFAYVVRFLAVAHQSVDTGLSNITRNMDEAAEGLGYTFGGILRKVHIPMLTGSLLTAMLLVMVDVLKELPATLIVRPFNFDTLAVQVYRLASDERLAESSGAALVIVLVGLIPVYVLSRSITKLRSRKFE
jgi:iron(III) transport system permease protein